MNLRMEQKVRREAERGLVYIEKRKRNVIGWFCLTRIEGWRAVDFCGAGVDGGDEF